MTKYILNRRHALISFPIILITLLSMSLMVGIQVAQAQSSDESEPKVQILTGLLDSDTIAVYRLLNLEEDQHLFVRMENTAGNLDPFVMLFAGDADSQAIKDEFDREVERVISSGDDPFVILPDFFDEVAIGWNDDSATSFNATFDTVIPDDGSYFLLASGAPAAETFGAYRLLLGLNEPGVLDGSARSTGDNFAVLDPTVSRGNVSIQEVTGEITETEPNQSYFLNPLSAGDTIYAYIEATSGDLKPALVLEGFGGKPMRGSNLSAEQSSANTEFKMDINAKNLSFGVGNTPGQSDVTTGTYRLLIGKNAPEVLSGKASPEGSPVIQEPIEVRVGSKLVQITDIDQLNEKFNAVAELRMEWQDPLLAFNPEECQCEFKTFIGDSFTNFADENEIIIPLFTINNQQGNRWVQNRNVVVFSDGRAIYQERYTTDLQAPLFDFRKFPFDTQLLYIRVDSLPIEDFFLYTDPAELSDIGDQLGEEEWFIVDSETDITSEDERASHWLYFSIRRHLSFYIFRIIVPLGLVIVVTWFTFFLRDFGRRVEVSGATLLTFVAFNFTVADNLPRLGYLTFMDALLVGAFVVSVIVVIYNVILKRLESDGRGELAHRIDKPMIWLYPILFILGAVIAIELFLL
jgi:hypothetical protein